MTRWRTFVRIIIPYLGLLVGPQVAYNVDGTRLTRALVSGAIAGGWGALVIGLRRWNRYRQSRSAHGLT